MDAPLPNSPRSLFGGGSKWDRRRVPSRTKRGEKKQGQKRDERAFREYGRVMGLHVPHLQSSFDKSVWEKKRVPRAPWMEPNYAEPLRTKEELDKETKLSLSDFTEFEVHQIHESLAGYAPLPRSLGRQELPVATKADRLVDRLCLSEYQREVPKLSFLLDELPAYEAEIAESKRQNDRFQEFHLTSVLATMHMNYDADKAMQYLRRCMELATEVESKSLEARTLCNLGTLYCVQNDTLRVIAYDKRHLELCQETRDKAGEAVANYNLACSHYLLQYNGKATKFLSAFLDITKTFSAETLTAMGETTLSAVHRIIRVNKQRKLEEEQEKAKRAAKAKMQR